VSGETLGKYTLLKKLASGGMAEVFLAKVAGPAGFEKVVVVKRILSHLAEDPKFVAMFLSEARLAAQLNHPNVVQVFDFGEQDGTWFLVMELIDGLNLRHLFRKAAEKNEFVPVPVALRIATMALEGLGYAHDFIDPTTGQPLGLVHRDVSPDNILVGRNGAVKVVDFGIAKAANQTHLTKTGTVKGKFAYMPPEQLQGQALDRRADVFAMGIVLYELLTTRKPFDTSNDAVVVRAILYEDFTPASTWRSEVPPELDAIIGRAFAKDPTTRYADCRAMATDLDRFLMSRGESPNPYDIAQVVQRLGGPSSIMVTPTPRPSPSVSGATAFPDPQRVAPTPATVPMEERVGLAKPSPDVVPPPPPEPTSGWAQAPLHRPADPGPSGTHRELDAIEAAPKPRSSAVVWGGVLAALALGGVVWVVRSRETPAPVEPQPVVEAPVVAKPLPPPALVEAPVAVKSPVVEPPTPAVPEAVLDAGALVEVAPPAVERAPVVDAGLVVAVRPTPRPIPSRPRSPPVVKTPPPPAVAEEPVDFRVRPFGTVTVDGKLLGDTPFPPVKLSPGPHQVKVVNGELGKSVTRTFEVKSGQPNVFRLNLEEGG
jgi:serine/threonine protein kinase